MTGIECVRNYCGPEYVAQTHHHKNLVNVVRMPSNRNVFEQMSLENISKRRESNQDNRGANIVYGQKYKLSEVNQWDLEAAIKTCFGIKLGNGKTCLVEMEIWEDMLVRSRRGHSIKPFRLVRIRLLDSETGLPLFKKTMWLCVWGGASVGIKSGRNLLVLSKSL